MANENSHSSGIGFTGLLFIVFLILKLLHQINWSWWWVTSPLWIPVALIAVGIVVYYLLKLFIYSLQKKKK